MNGRRDVAEREDDKGLEGTAPQVCFVVNAVDKTSVPADIATALTRRTDVNVDILAWFEAGDFDGSDVVDLACLDAPNTTLGIDYRTYREATRFLRNYDLVQVHHNHSGTFAKLIGKRLGIPVVSREGNTRDGFNRLGRIANGLTNGLADVVVPNSQAVYDSFTAYEKLLIGDDDVRIINNGVDFERIDAQESDWSVSEAADVDDGSVLVGTAAMLTEQKAYDVLLAAVDRANRHSDVDLELLVAGDGPLRGELEAQADSLGISDSVHFLGLLDRRDVYRLMAEIDVFAMPSRWEGFSAAAVEALGIGNACVFSDIDPFTGPFEDVAAFHAVDDAKSLADLLVAFSLDPGKRERYASRAREHVRRHYSMDRVASEYRAVYRSLLGA